MNITEQLEMIGKGIDPSTGEVYDVRTLQHDAAAQNAILKLYGIAFPEARIKKPQPANKLNRPTDKIFQQLKEWRLNTAAILGLPPYMVFTDEELRNIAGGDVVDQTDLLRCKGVGARKYELYGREVYDILKEYF